MHDSKLSSGLRNLGEEAREQVASSKEYVTRKISVSHLRMGMRVVLLDRPWEGTPFMFQGFRIHSQREIEALQKYCAHVFVDVDTLVSNIGQQRFGAARPTRDEVLDKAFTNRKKDRFQDSVTLQKELSRVGDLRNKIEKSISDFYLSIERGRQFSLDQIKPSVHELTESVVRNPDAMIWLANLKNKDSYSYRHAFSTAVWSAALGRQIGLPKHELRSLALAALLCDIGKIKVDKTIIEKPSGLTPQEFEQVKKHVEHSVQILRSSAYIADDIIAIVACHHERHNGSGYPRGLSGNQIPVFARIVGIADSYDAMCSERSYSVSYSPSAAVKQLLSSCDDQFQPELVEEFIQAIGIYPAGSLVELSTGEVGVVIAEGRSRRLRPQIILLLDSGKKRIRQAQLLDLDKVELSEDGLPLQIKQGLEPGTYGVDMDELFT